jgi:hypothetical protein
MVQWCDDVDRMGVSLHNFAAEMMIEALAFGICGILVDYPSMPVGSSLADERIAGARPYFIRVKHD